MSEGFRVVNTSLTMLRGDAHVDITYGLEDPVTTFADCLHCCSPGAPDYW